MNLSATLTSAISVLALATSAVSVVISTRQASLQDKANNAAAVIAILADLRDPALHDSFEYVFNQLDTYDPGAGLSGIPSVARHHAYNVCYFLNQVGCMLVLDVLRQDAFLALHRARAVAVWRHVGPFIRHEREINPELGPEFMSVVEALANKAEGIGPEVGRGLLQDWLGRKVPGTKIV